MKTFSVEERQSTKLISKKSALKYLTFLSTLWPSAQMPPDLEEGWHAQRSAHGKGSVRIFSSLWADSFTPLCVIASKRSGNDAVPRVNSSLMIL